MPTREQQTNARRFAAGALSGMTSVLFTYPLELIRVRMAFHTRNPNGPSSPRPTFLYAMSKIHHESPTPTASSSSPPSSKTIPTSIFTRFPILKFYRGFSVSVVGMIPYAGTSFLAWGYLRSVLLPPPPDAPPGAKPPKSANPVADLSIGALSGAVAQTASYPFEVVRRRMQVGGLTHPDRWLRWGETVRTIWSAKGFKGFYVGLSIGYLKVVPMTAVSYAAWQWGKRILGV